MSEIGKFVYYLGTTLRVINFVIYMMSLRTTYVLQARAKALRENVKRKEFLYTHRMTNIFSVILTDIRSYIKVHIRGTLRAQDKR